jgi:hypothetical protein
MQEEETIERQNKTFWNRTPIENPKVKFSG